MAKIGSTGNGKASSMSVGNIGAGTVVGNVRDGSDASSNKSMSVGKGSGAKKGIRGTYLAAAAGPGYHTVAVGTLGGATGSAGKNGLPLASTGQIPGVLPGAAITLSPSGKSMKEGKKASTTANTHKGFL